MQSGEYGAMMLGGEPAIVLDHVPGETSYRVIIIVYRERVYQIWVGPVGDLYPAVQEDIERVWDIVTKSFTFLIAQG